MQSASSMIWTLVADSIRNDDNRYDNHSFSYASVRVSVWWKETVWEIFEEC